MRSPPRAVPAALVAVLATAVAGATEHVEVRLERGRVTVPASRSVSVRQGEEVELRWHSDRDGGVHLHGYDIELGLAAGAVSVMAFRASAAGRFPVTSHGIEGAGADLLGRHRTLLHVEVQPR